MKKENLNDKIVNAAKWSSITELAAKLVNPIINMILARIVIPEAFGVVATVNMIMSFADMFIDAGFQKYMVQHEFKNECDKHKSASVAFWTNFGISIILWVIIVIFREQISVLVGNPGLGNVIAIASFQLPLTSFSSIQMALYRRDFDFKTLFIVRMVSIFIPFAITIPLALLGFSYWALIIGTISIQISNAFLLTKKSKWKPNFFYSVKILKQMISYSIWLLAEAISIWLITWIDVFIIGSSFNQYFLGLYKTSTTLVSSIITLVTAPIVTVLFSALSRLQNDDSKFINMYLKVQKSVSILAFPLGVGILLYSKLVTRILLGSQWIEASDLIGVWAFTSSVVIVFGNLAVEVYRSKGMPKLSFLVQILHLVILVPICIISSKYGFWTLVYVRSWIRLEAVLVHFAIMKFVFGISAINTIKNVLPTAISAILMGVIGYLLKKISEGILWSFVSIIICVLFYFGILYLFPSMRKEINKIIERFRMR